ncbi:MAG: alpha/beta hydrolase [Geothrix sp.]|uniref:alpha/beta fold hydrolase n=1 Tax=Geothrix sp. TaxID=1962974 RepID=UPI0018227D3D|nr:alpha/beta hydrolase [Geothrix sp.]NWJ40819.1 alpha/beta hydrolase [Geothrix sp.]WIL21179.1 MAG: alpha/beta hydrolase [Geothrix sp.]
MELRPDHYLSGHSVGVALRHVSVDQPGTGGSAWIPGWKPEDTVDDAAEFLRLRGITEPVLLEGWSWGSTMALLFAQRHPRLVRGIVIGGMWTNTRKEVRAYLDADGARAWMPGWTEQFSVFTNGHGSACDLHRAIREGAGGGTLAEAYDAAESEQAGSGQIPRQPLPGPIPRVSSPTPVDMETESDETIRFAYIESEMMCRGQRGIWRLRLQFPRRLASVPLVVIQGRYDQVCLPETAQRVVRAWPGSRKLLVPMNGGHGSFRSPRREDLERAGVSLPAEQQWALEKAAMLSYGNGGLLKRAALECLAGAGQQ